MILTFNFKKLPNLTEKITTVKIISTDCKVSNELKKPIVLNIGRKTNKLDFNSIDTCDLVEVRNAVRGSRGI